MSFGTVEHLPDSGFEKVISAAVVFHGKYGSHAAGRRLVDGVGENHLVDLLVVGQLIAYGIEWINFRLGRAHIASPSF